MTPSPLYVYTFHPFLPQYPNLIVTFTTTQPPGPGVKNSLKRTNSYVKSYKVLFQNSYKHVSHGFRLKRNNDSVWTLLVYKEKVQTCEKSHFHPILLSMRPRQGSFDPKRRQDVYQESDVHQVNQRNRGKLSKVELFMYPSFLSVRTRSRQYMGTRSLIPSEFDRTLNV